jgi:alkylation response protein AidB-like acyl-CoA dehydrogenase
MDVRLSAEQQALRDTAAQVADRLGPHAVRQLDDVERTAKLDAAVAASGWRELRAAIEDGPVARPLATVVEVAIVAEELGRGLADAAFLGPTLATELRRLAGAPSATRTETFALAPDLSTLACALDGSLAAGALAVDAAGSTAALVLVEGGGGYTLGMVDLPPTTAGCDLTRPAVALDYGSRVSPVPDQTRVIRPEALAGVTALGLALACADLVGTMRGAVHLATEYAKERRQFGVAIGSFQAVQHLLADAFVSTEGSRSVALHAAWAADALPPHEALAAAAVAKAYCARAARTVCETAIQVHGGIGNTWECLAHLYLRRAVLSSDVFGGVGPSLARVLDSRGIGDSDGLR